MSHWLTPEEVIRKKKRRQWMLYILIPLLGGLVGALVTILINGF